MYDLAGTATAPVPCRGPAVVGGPVRDRPGRGPHDPGQDLAVPAGRHRRRRRDPRLGARGPVRPLGRPRQPAGRPDRGDAGHPAVLQRRRGPAAGGGAVRQGPADGHRPGVHDVGRRAVAARDDPAAPGPQAPADRHVRRRGRRRDPRRRLPVQPRSCEEHSPCPRCTSRSSAPAAPTARPWRPTPARPSTELGLDATIDKVTDYAAIAGYGVMSTPGLVIDGHVVSTGRVPTAVQIAELLGQRASAS